MQVITDAPTLMRQLGAYAFNPATDAELAEKLQTMPGSDVDKMFLAMELLNTFRDRLGPAGLELLAQLAGYAQMQNWEIPAKPGRIAGLLNGAKRDLGEPGIDQLVEDDPDPILVYRADGVNWKEDVTPDLDALKASKRKAVNAMKSEREAAGAPTPFGVADSSLESMIKINGLVTGAMAAKSVQAPFEHGFTLADDSTVIVDASMMIGLGLSVMSFVSSVHAHSRDLKAALETADTIEEINAVDIENGWPGQVEETPVP